MDRARTLRALLLTAALAMTACTATSNSASGSSPAVAIVSPSDGSTVGSPVALMMSVSGAEIGTPETGNPHFHVRVDGSSEYQIVYATTASLNLSAGEHRIEVVLARPNHEETSSSASITVQVTGGAQGSPAPTPTSGLGY
jgi:hypothetical protein